MHLPCNAKVNLHGSQPHACWISWSVWAAASSFRRGRKRSCISFALQGFPEVHDHSSVCDLNPRWSNDRSHLWTVSRTFIELSILNNRLCYDQAPMLAPQNIQLFWSSIFWKNRQDFWFSFAWFGGFCRHQIKKIFPEPWVIGKRLISLPFQHSVGFQELDWQRQENKVTRRCKFN